MEIGLTLNLIWVGDGLVPDLVPSIPGIGEELSETDIDNEVTGVETDTELDVASRSRGLHEGLGEGLCDGAQIVDQLVLGHANPALDGGVSFVRSDLDVEIGLCPNLIWAGNGDGDGAHIVDQLVLGHANPTGYGGVGFVRVDLDVELGLTLNIIWVGDGFVPDPAQSTIVLQRRGPSCSRRW